MKGVPWGKEQEQVLIAGWPDPFLSAQDIAARIGLSLSAVRSKAHKLGLPKKARGVPPVLQTLEAGVAKVRVVGDGGHIVLLDEPDVGWFIGYPGGWIVHAEQGQRYVYARKAKPVQRLHRLLLQAKAGELVDHINRNGLDNRRSNLRIVNDKQNNHNSGPRRHARSEYKGVWRHVDGLYGGAIKEPSGKRHSIGYYETEIEAARAHDAVALFLRGEFAFLNLPEDRMSEADIRRIPALAALILGEDVSRRPKRDGVTGRYGRARIAA